MGAKRFKQSVAAKKFDGTDVWEAALQRMRHIYDMHDLVTVAFSGGKDSTATLHVALEVARERDAPPLRVVFFDEEAIPYETEDYVRRVGERDDVDLRWYCIPLKENNACSTAEPLWWPWAPESEEKWVRPMPPEALTWESIEGWPTDPFDRPAHIDGVDLLLYGRDDGQVCVNLGIRAAESLTRFRAVNRRSHGEDNYVVKSSSRRFLNHGNIWRAYPIYDWSTADVWTAPAKFGWDYNEAYDVMAMAGVSASQQRCSPAYGAEPLQKLHTFRECFPDIWEKMIERVPGAGAAARYALTELYGYRALPPKPDDMRWIEFVRIYLDRQAPVWRVKTRRQIEDFIRRHFGATSDPILNVNHPVTGLTWHMLVVIAMRGDPRDRKQPGTKAAVSPEAYRLMRETYDRELKRLREEDRMWEVEP